MSFKNLSKATLAVAALIVSSNSFADGTVPGFNLGGNLGYGSVSSSEVGFTTASGLGFGGRIGYRFDSTWELGGQFDYRDMTSSAVALGFTSLNFSMASLDLDYHFVGDLNPLYIGIRAGYAFLGSTPAFPAGFGTGSFGFGALAGYDFTLVPSLTVGPQLSYTYILSPSTPQGVTGSSFNWFQALASVKYWF